MTYRRDQRKAAIKREREQEQVQEPEPEDAPEIDYLQSRTDPTTAMRRHSPYQAGGRL
jgi:hypothetical protein